MRKTVSIIGSTGSIGVQALEVALARGHTICALAAGQNDGRLLEQALRFKPRLVALYDGEAAARLRASLAGSGIVVAEGEAGVCAAAAAPESDIVLNAAVGIAGLRPTMAAIRAKKTLALANKESLVCAGPLVMACARANGVKIIPVDSEHSALFQCMRAGGADEIVRVVLTASGGPFFGKTAGQLKSVTRAQALAHPNWSMGAKITVDSATMMNKGFEMLEAQHLFGLMPDQIDAVVHRESIVHALVEFCDGATIAQLSPPDMGLAIQYALDWPRRFPAKRERLDLVKQGSLTFFAPDTDTFPALALCRQAMVRGGSLGAVINGANEEAVALFLADAIAFSDITALVARAAGAVPHIDDPSLEDIFEADRAARAFVRAEAR